MGTWNLSSTMRSGMVPVGWAAPQVRSPGTNWNKLAPSSELLKYPAVVKSRGDTQAGLILPLWQSTGAAGPDPAIPQHRARRAGRE